MYPQSIENAVRILEAGPGATREQDFTNAVSSLMRDVGAGVDRSDVSLHVVFDGMASGMDGIFNAKKWLLTYYGLQSRFLPAWIVLAIQAAGFVLAVRQLRQSLTGAAGAAARSTVVSVLKGLFYLTPFGASIWLGKKLLSDKDFDGEGTDALIEALNGVEAAISMVLPAPVQTLFNNILNGVPAGAPPPEVATGTPAGGGGLTDYLSGLKNALLAGDVDTAKTMVDDTLNQLSR